MRMLCGAGEKEPREKKKGEGRPGLRARGRGDTLRSGARAHKAT